MVDQKKVISQTETWIKRVVIDCHFCPFAAVPVRKNAVRYVVASELNISQVLELLLVECKHLDEDETTITGFIIIPDMLHDFMEYLDFLHLAENLLKKEGYEGVYQLAGFHPDYLFAGSDENDAANFTNRSVYPMLHLLRESSLDEALENYEEPESIPERNIAFARKKGVAYMKMLRDSILNN